MLIYVLQCVIYFQICRQACSLSKHRTFCIEETKHVNWKASFMGACRCYATVEHYSQPPSNTVTLVIHSYYY